MMEHPGDSRRMTGLERLLKERFMERPDVTDHILTSEELADYVEWMVQTYGGRDGSRVSAENIFGRQNGTMRSLANRILADPGDASALRELRAGYSTQREDRYILAEHDITFSSILRYMPAHWHANDYFEVMYCLGGACPVYFHGDVVQLQAGSLIIIAPGVEHANPCYADDAVLFSYMVRSSTFERVFWRQMPPASLLGTFFHDALSEGRPNSYLQFETGEDEEFQRVMLEIMQEDRRCEAFSENMKNALLRVAFILLLRRYEGTARLPRSEDFYWKHEFSGILSYIQTNYASVSLRELSTLFHYSERQIARIVERCTGSRYQGLIRKLKMEKAADLVRAGSMSIGQIADETGYSTVSSFYRAFVGYHGCTPLELRRRR